MIKAILCDLFETLITESSTRPPAVSSLASRLECEGEAFRAHWKRLRPAVLVGRLSFGEAIREITATLGRPVDDLTLDRLRGERVRVKAAAFERIEPDILFTLDHLRSRGIRLAVVSNCFAEDVTAWRTSVLARRFDCTVFSFAVGKAKPDPEIYREATRRLAIDAADAWFIGDGGNQELHGAERTGLRTSRALWFLRRWPHFRDDAPASSDLGTVTDILNQI